MWHLPGPQSLLADVARAVDRQQHVSVVLPRYLLDSDEIRAGLTNSILGRVDGARPINIWDVDLPLVEALGRQMTNDDYPPTALPDLLQHADVAGISWVLDVSELGEGQRTELPQFLERVALESRSVPGIRRATFITVMSIGSLPSFAGHEHADITYTSCWYWNRVARWDVAAHIANVKPAGSTDPVVSEVRTEIIVELARWDLSFAAMLAEEWDGALQSFASYAAERHEPIESTVLGGINRFRHKPPDALLAYWDEGSVEVWHDELTSAPGTGGREADINRCLWTAQARVLLPWIEVKRNHLQSETERVLGRQVFHDSVRAYSSAKDGPVEDGGIVEIGLLEKVIRYELKRSHPGLARAAGLLRYARNNLAHLVPMELAVIEDLVENLRPVTANSTPSAKPMILKRSA